MTYVRPLISSIGTYSYNLAKLSLLFSNPLVSTTNCTKDSIILCQEIKKVKTSNKFLVFLCLWFFYQHSIPNETIRPCSCSVLVHVLIISIHTEQKIRKCNKIIGLIRRLSVCLPRKALLTIYKSFVRPHLDYGDILYDKPGNLNFESKIEKVQYKA